MGSSLASLGSGGRRGRRRKVFAPMSEINVTPFVDVMLVLLIIFMVTAPLLASGVPIELPDSRANALDQQPDQVTIAIDRDGFIYIDDGRVPEGGFAEAMTRVNCGREDAPLITLRADRVLDYGRVMAVMGEINRAGLRHVALVSTQRGEAR